MSCEGETSRARRRLVVRGGDLSCEAETCRARLRLVPPVGNRSKMQPPGQRLGILPVRVLSKIYMPALRRNTS
jgi:hypothetical protein